MNKVCSNFSILLHSAVFKTICDPGNLKKKEKETQLNDSVIYCCLKGNF